MTVSSSVSNEPVNSSSSSVDLDSEVIGALVDTLRNHGVEPSPDLIDDLAQVVGGAALFHSCRLHEAALRHVPKTPGGEAVARFVLKDPESARSAAARIGCDHSSLLRAEKKLRRFMGV